MADDNFIDMRSAVWNFSLFSEQTVHEFHNGKLYNAYDFFGSHKIKVNETEGFYFSVWAPAADFVSVIGDFNGWKQGLHKLNPRLDKSGIWEGFIPSIQEGFLYKYSISSSAGEFEKADPYARFAELRPATASITYTSSYAWKDDNWLNNRHNHNSLKAPWNVYEVHLGSWRRPDKNNENSFNSYLYTANELVKYVTSMGFTHIEIMPVMEYPYDGSWGYQATGFFAPTHRFGTPDEFKEFIDIFHRNNIGVILDWVPSHFPGDEHGLYLFDGFHTYEYADMRKGFHPDWNSYIFNYKRGEVISFLLSSAHFWLSQYHADGLRVDAVNSIIRLDFSRKEGEWVPNELGTNANLEAIDFIKSLNSMVYQNFTGVQTIAEEASDWPGITHNLIENGLGFGMKWMMGWMHDTFRYFKTSPEQRPAKQNDLTFSIMYFYDERFMLPISHDEVVHGKSSLIYKMPGNENEKFANLRLLFTYMIMHPGGKLLFMGNEFGQTSEWNYNSELKWELLQFDIHNKTQECLRDLNFIFKNNPAAYQLQFDKKGFKWLSLNEKEEGILIFRRMGINKNDDLIVVLNVSEKNYTNRKYVWKGKTKWKEIFNSNNIKYHGNGNCQNDHNISLLKNKKQQSCEIILNIPALSGMIFR